MKKTVEVYLEDILESIKKIENYLQDVSYEQFVTDTKTQDAVIRNIEIIGEATKRLPKDFFEKHPDFPSRETISMRNFLIHDYDNIDLEVIWKTAYTDIPKLKEKISHILS